MSSEKAVHDRVRPSPASPEQLDPLAVLSHNLYQCSNWNSPWGALLVTLKNRYRVHGGEIRSASLVGVQLLVAKFSSGLFKLAGDCAERQPLYVLVRVGFF